MRGEHREAEGIEALQAELISGAAKTARVVVAFCIGALAAACIVLIVRVDRLEATSDVLRRRVCDLERVTSTYFLPTEGRCGRGR